MIKFKRIIAPLIYAILILLLVNACVSNNNIKDDIQSTAMTSIVQTQTTQPTRTPTFTVTIQAIATYSSLPPATQFPIAIITPDIEHVKRWKEYQSELAKLVLSHPGGEYSLYEYALCEWDILGNEGDKLYVWAECGYDAWGNGPAVIYLDADSSIKDVEYAFPQYGRDEVIKKLFTPDVQVKIYMYFSSSRSREMVEHINYRFLHPEEPPLIVLLNLSVNP